MFRLISGLLALFIAVVATTAALAQERPRTILVFDASGSMWGQIDGVAKITIAQDVVSGLLSQIPEGTELGLTAYGHRRKGDCADIEMLVPPGPGNRDAIADAVRAIKPVGKTPLSASVIAAAEALKYGEEAATVILISDGIETCEMDPCAVGRQLEETGVDFTAHVVGFDLGSDPVAQAQLRCLAENTGGIYRDAANAAELAEALTTIVTAAPQPEPAPVPVGISFIAVETPGDARIATPLIWEVLGAEGALSEPVIAPEITVQMLPGMYRVEVTRPEDELTVTGEFEAYTNGQTVQVALPEYLPPAVIEAPGEAAAGATIQVGWTGPGGERDYIAVSAPDQTDNQYINYTYTDGGTPLDLVMPPEPGEYELRYVSNADNRVLARIAITVTPVEASVEAPQSAPAGATIDVGWTGPGYDRDYISVAKTDDKDSAYVNYTYIEQGSPLKLVMPVEPGTYELRYVINQDQKVLLRKPITVTPVEASVQAPVTAPAGASLDVGWTGPGYERDYISVARTDDKDSAYVNYTYIEQGSPLTLVMPPVPGDYEIRYVVNQDQKVLVRAPISVAPVEAQLQGPKTASVGSTVQIGWTGPGYSRDYVSVAKAGDNGGRYIAYTYVDGGSPIELAMPTEPGSYELRYVMNQGQTILASLPITVE